ncbi:hypothetical protein F9Z46_21310 [Escherichia coli]|nr:hypothetical protein [Escherichia coli]KAB3436789.1 hypothetical protein F9Z46_21310 [Escherichia coli]
MGSKMNKRHITIYFISILLAPIIIFCGYWYSRHNLSFTCSTSTESFYNNVGNKPFMDFTQNIKFSYSGKATVSISGILHTQDGKNYALNRSIIYDYEYININQYRLNVSSTLRAGNDNIPVSLELKHLMPVLIGVNRVIDIRRLENGNMIFSNNAGPFFICAVH